jgi:hypothetical protein
MLEGMTETQRKWAERVVAWKASGQTLREFAEGKPYEAKTLCWWGSELRRRGLLARAASKGGQRRARGEGTPAVPMARVVARRNEAVAAAAAGVAVEVGGARVVVEAGFDAEVLGSVVRALRGAS